MTLFSAIAHYFLGNEMIRFAAASFSLLFWAVLLGKATESTAHYAGERLGGFLNATFGNAAELIIAIFLVREGLIGMVKASITGSIIGNMLLVLGLSLLLGGLKHKTQTFNQMLAGHNASLMMLAVIALFISAAFFRDLATGEAHLLSLTISGLLILGYLLWLLFSMVTHKELLSNTASSPRGKEEEEIPAVAAAQNQAFTEEKPDWSLKISILLLLISTVFVAVQSEWLVGSIEAVAHTLGWSDLFIGAFLIAIIGNAAEHSAAIFLALKDRVDATVEIAIGSSLQIALFVAPTLVFISLLFRKPMELIFTGYELVAIAVSVLIATSISRDGSTNWYEGVLLLIVYAILGTAFFMA
ncbi:calcium/proton exchanger [Paludifilum halophilum]|uniref:Ca(2+)/H(+) antiporter n=1 Tax=Paludifilum halophilum TaxID=1642702 RepID=A0A235BC82_9BACL|nr:calcium/proton exchanger [Paludifilum halophilum]OYD09175.1 calcium/proton exchanger [Paludifilum halophilum]